MNIAETSNRKVADLRLPRVSCDPKVVAQSQWRNVRIECRAEASDLSSVTFEGCDFRDCYLGNSKLNLEGVIFRDCRLREVTFMFGHLRGAQFLDTELRDCHLRSADLRDAVSRRTRLVSVNLEKVDLHGAVFEDTELEAMENWGWHGYEGASISDEQKFKYFIATDVSPRLEEALRSDSLSLQAGSDLRPFIAALHEIGFDTGEVMLIFEELRDYLDFEAFIAIGKYLTRSATGG